MGQRQAVGIHHHQSREWETSSAVIRNIQRTSFHGLNSGMTSECIKTCNISITKFSSFSLQALTWLSPPPPPPPPLPPQLLPLLLRLEQSQPTTNTT